MKELSQIDIYRTDEGSNEYRLEILTDEERMTVRFWWFKNERVFFYHLCKLNAALILNHIVMYMSAETADLGTSFLLYPNEVI